jgi:hypothetical protein
LKGFADQLHCCVLRHGAHYQMALVCIPYDGRTPAGIIPPALSQAILDEFGKDKHTAFSVSQPIDSFGWVALHSVQGNQAVVRCDSALGMPNAGGKILAIGCWGFVNGYLERFVWATTLSTQKESDLLNDGLVEFMVTLMCSPQERRQQL